MSLILEALKKSEAERRLGHAPGLMTPMPATRRRPRSGAIAKVLLGVAVLAAGASAWWLARGAPDEGSMKIAPEIPASNPQAASIPVAVVAAPSLALPTTVPQPVVAAPVDTMPLPRDPEFDSVERESIPVAAKASPPAGPRVGPVSPPPVAIAAFPSVEAPVSAATLDDSVVDDLLRLDQLPASEREALPSLKLSMHVYTDSPATRFVLIDGRRYGEGENLAPSLQIVEIRRNGTVLNFNGRRFLLQRP